MKFPAGRGSQRVRFRSATLYLRRLPLYGSRQNLYPYADRTTSSKPDVNLEGAAALMVRQATTDWNDDREVEVCTDYQREEPASNLEEHR